MSGRIIYKQSPASNGLNTNQQHDRLRFNSSILGKGELLQRISLFGLQAEYIPDTDFSLRLMDANGAIIKTAPFVVDGGQWTNDGACKRFSADMGGIELARDSEYSILILVKGVVNSVFVQGGYANNRNKSVLRFSSDFDWPDTIVACEMEAKSIARGESGFSYVMTSANDYGTSNIDISIDFDSTVLWPRARKVSVKRLAFAFTEEPPLNTVVSIGNRRTSISYSDKPGYIWFPIHYAEFDPPVDITPGNNKITVNCPAKLLKNCDYLKSPEKGFPSMRYIEGGDLVRPCVVIMAYTEEIGVDPVYSGKKEVLSSLHGTSEIKLSGGGNIGFLGSYFKGRSPILREVSFKSWQAVDFPSASNVVTLSSQSGDIVDRADALDYGGIKTAVFSGNHVLKPDVRYFLGLRTKSGAAGTQHQGDVLIAPGDSASIPELYGAGLTAIELCADVAAMGSRGPAREVDISDLSAMGGRDFTHNEASFSESTLEFNLPIENDTSPSYFADRERVRIVDGDHTIIEGTISAETMMEGGTHFDHYIVTDDWLLLNDMTFLSHGTVRGIPGSDFYMGDGMYSLDSGVVINTGRETMPISVAFSQLLTYAEIDYELRIDDASEMIPFRASAEKVGQLLQAVRKWRPNMVAWFDYTDGANKLIIADHTRLDVKTFDISDRRNSTCKIKARPDLSPPVVAIYCEYQKEKGDAYYSISQWPLDESTRQPWALLVKGPDTEAPYVDDAGEDPDPDEVEIVGPSWEMNLDKMTVKGKNIQNTPAGLKEFVLRHIPALRSYREDIIPVDGTGTVTGLEYDGDDKAYGYDTNAIKQELIEGSIAKKCGIKWCNTEVKITLLLKGTKNYPKEIQGYFPDVDSSGNGKGYFSFRVTTISRGGTYVIGGSITEYPGEEEPEEENNQTYTGEGDVVSDKNGRYLGLVRGYYESTRKLQHEGSMDTVDPDYEISVKNALNVTGGRKEYEVMEAQVQRVTRNLHSGATSIVIGPNTHLSLEDALSRNSLNKQVEQSEQDRQENESEPANPNQYPITYEWEKKDREFPTVGPSCVASHSSAISVDTPLCPFAVTVEKVDGVWKAKVNAGVFRNTEGDSMKVGIESNGITIPEDSDCFICLTWSYTVAEPGKEAQVSRLNGSGMGDTVIASIETDGGVGSSRIGLAFIKAINDVGVKEVVQMTTTHMRAKWKMNYKNKGSRTVSAAQDAEPSIAIKPS